MGDDRISLKTLRDADELERNSRRTDVPVIEPSELFQIPNQGSGSGMLRQNGWMEKYIRRACVLVMDAPPVNAVLRAVPAGNLDKLETASWRGSFRALDGVLKIPAPGKWAFRYEGTGTLTVIIYDDVGDVAEFEAARALDGGGVVSSVTNTFASIGVADTAVLAANAARKWAAFVNDSANVIYLAFGTAAIVGSGIRLNANGGSFEMSKKLGNLSLGTVRGISGVAAQNLTVVEGS